jgi:outer membrane protein
MNKKIALLFVCALGAVVMSASAALAEGNIGVLDVQKLMANSLASKSIREQIDKKREQYQQEISKDEDRLRKKDKDLAEQRNVMAPDKFEQEKNAFKTEVETVQRDVQKKRVQLDRAYAKAFAEVQEAVTGVVKEVAAEQKLNLVLPSGQTLFFDPKMDITDTVVSRLDKKISKVSVKLEALEDIKDGGEAAAPAPAKEGKAKKAK